MTLDIEKLAKEIMIAVNKKMKQDTSKGAVGFAEVCFTCGSGSTSFCPCGEIKRILNNPPEHCIVKK